MTIFSIKRKMASSWTTGKPNTKLTVLVDGMYAHRVFIDVLQEVGKGGCFN